MLSASNTVCRNLLTPVEIQTVDGYGKIILREVFGDSSEVSELLLLVN